MEEKLSEKPNETPAEPTSEVEYLQGLIAKAKAGDASVLPELRDALADKPAVWDHFGNLGQMAENAWLKKIAGQNLCLTEGVKKRLQAMREELLGKEATVMDELLVRRVSLTFLQVEFYEMTLASLPEDVPKQHLTFVEKRRDSAHKRHLEAIKTLKDVRRLVEASPHSVPIPRAVAAG